MTYVTATGELLVIREGSTLDEPWISYDGDELPGNETDWTGWTAEAMIRRDFDGGILLHVPSVASITPGPTFKGVALGMVAGGMRVYAGSTVTAQLNKESFDERRDEEGRLFWQGVWDLEIIDGATNERHRYLEGPVRFFPEVTHD